MKKILFTSILAMPLLLVAEPDHLLITELVVQPSNGEYAAIYNPTDAMIDLNDYYLTDATDVARSNYYYKLPTGTDFRSSSGSDFVARFPEGAQIVAHGQLIISMGTKNNYQLQYGVLPDLSIKEDFRSALTSENTIGAAPSYLDNVSETLILFYWDGSSSTVKDVDYLLWGNRSYAIDKSGVSGYLNDTPIGQQQFMPSHTDGEKLQRISGEGTELQTGGNGITGHDETSENFSETWQVVSVSNTKPRITNITLTPDTPTTEDLIQVSARVSDDDGLSWVELVYRFGSNRNQLAMSFVSGTQYRSPEFGPLSGADSLYFYVRAEDNTGLQDSSSIYAIKIQEPPKKLTIAAIRDNWGEYNGQTVTLSGVVSIGSNILRTDRTSAYFQDESGRGLNLFDYNPTNLNRGDSIEITGILDEYAGVYELTSWANQYTVLKTSVAIPNVQEVPIQALLENPIFWEGAFFEINGTVAERADNVGGGSNVILEDVTGRTTIRIWDTTNMLFNSIGELVNLYVDSLLQIGNRVVIHGVGSIYSGSPQVLLGYAEDVEPYTEGEPGTEKLSLNIAPYPFVPQLGEVIQYSYEYPSNCRVILRVYDLAGRFVTTLIDDYYAVSWTREATWNGRNELNQLVAPGNYIFHLEATDRSTGKTLMKMAPVVVGVKLK
jgi:DNA/RNA endonuclease YhcR with UshA esterase domain